MNAMKLYLKFSNYKDFRLIWSYRKRGNRKGNAIIICKKKYYDILIKVVKFDYKKQFKQKIITLEEIIK